MWEVGRLMPAGRRRVWLGAMVAGGVLSLGVVPGASATQAAVRPPAGQVSPASWQTPEPVPGIRVRPFRHPFSAVNSVSCPSAGNCTAVGSYTKANWTDAFLVNRVGGTWRTARKIPGLATLSPVGQADAAVVSCGGTGNCSLGGNYNDSANQRQAFVDTESRGTWHQAEEVPGTAALNGGGSAGVVSLSCGAPGNCGAAGFTSSGPFIANETGGKWGSAEAIPGLAALNQGNNAQVASISCPSASNCTVAGQYADSAHHTQLFVATEAAGGWGNAMQIPGTTTSKNGQVISVSCASAGNCSAVGYDVPATAFKPFVVSETNGVWANAENVTGITSFTSLSCGSAANCVAGGGTGSAFSSAQAIVLKRVNGTWGKGVVVPGTPALNPVNEASVTSVSCPSAGNCAVAGFVTQPQGDYTVALPFVEDEISGSWDQAQVYYSGVGPAGINSVSCASAQNCSAGGAYSIGNGCDGRAAAFVVDETPAARDATTARPARTASPAVC